MRLSEAIKTLDGTIPPPDNKMVDREHLEISIAWKVIKESLYAHRNKLCDFCRFADECNLNYGDSEECKVLVGEGGDS